MKNITSALTNICLAVPQVALNETLAKRHILPININREFNADKLRMTAVIKIYIWFAIGTPTFYIQSPCFTSSNVLQSKKVMCWKLWDSYQTDFQKGDRYDETNVRYRREGE
jgi:hypothetical protein